MELFVIAYCTVNSGYEREMQRLVESLQHHGLRHEVARIRSLGSWQANTQFKAQFIKSAIEKHSDKRLLL